MPGASLESILTILVPILHAQGRPGSIEACRALLRSGRPSGAPEGSGGGFGQPPMIGWFSELTQPFQMRLVPLKRSNLKLLNEL